jgi:hypothetical protein
MPKQNTDEAEDLTGSTNGTIEDASAGDSESEDDLGKIDPSLLGKAVVAGTDWTADTLIQQLEKRNIELDPAFQRRDAWSLSRKSKFIESVVLGLPIPQIVLAEKLNNRGKFLVIDGKQRLLSLQQFAGVNLRRNELPLVLKDLLVRTELNGKTYGNLQDSAGLRSYLTAFDNQPIRTIVVRNWQNEKVLYLIFHRLNTSSVPLSPQELRQALHPGKFLQFAVEYSEKSLGLQRALNLSKPDFRMRDVELLIRYYAYRNFIGDYAGNLKDFLDKACQALNSQWKNSANEIASQAEDVEKAISTTFKIFGKDCSFRKWDGEKFERRFNRAVFDIMVYYFSNQETRRRARARAPAVREAFKELCARNRKFRASLETTTKSLGATSTRLSKWGRALKHLGAPVRIPKLKKSAKKS